MPILLALVLAGSPPRSIYRTGPADIAVVGASAFLVAGAYTFGNGLITPHCPCDPNRINALDRSVVGEHSRLADYGSDVGVGLALVAPAVVSLVDVRSGPVLREDLTVEIEAVAVAGVVVTGLKYVIQRPLPVVYAGQAPSLVHRAEGYRSFPSGHTALVAASLAAGASTWTARHGPAVWPWLVVGGTAVAVGAGRIAAGQHFYTDVAVGAGLGLAAGLVVPAVHRRGSDLQPMSGLQLVPLPGGALATYAAAW